MESNLLLIKDLSWPDIHPLFNALMKDIPQQCERVFKYEYCEIDCNFLGFMDIYEALSKIIPKHFTIVDIGCAESAQSYYFKDHKLYIGTDIVDNERFSFSNTVHWLKTIPKICRAMSGYNLKETFAIMNYVPCSDRDAKMIRETFPNLYCFYPHGGL